MARITVDDCLKRISNRFQLTLAATYRARQLSAGASPLVEPNRDKSTVIALREIASGKVGTEVLRRNATPAALPWVDHCGTRRSAKCGKCCRTAWLSWVVRLSMPKG